MAAKPSGEKLTDLAIAINSFAIEIYKHIKNNKSNVFFSPQSIATALAMTLLGAKNNTKAQILEVLGCEAFAESVHDSFKCLLNMINSDKKCTLEACSKMYIAQKFNLLEDFRTDMLAYYKTEATHANFASNPEHERQTINTWVAETTSAKIKNFLSAGSICSDTILVLVNAIYFKGNWEKRFNPEHTKKMTFHVSAETTVETDMMFQSGEFNFGISDPLQCLLLELPYVNHDLSMFIFLPMEHDGIASAEQNLTADVLSSVETQVRPTQIQVNLPKFHLEESFNLEETLTSLGMCDAFDSCKADFSGMNGKKDLYISTVIHKARLDVNEEGTEAAAATAVVMRKRSMPKRFIADHPFIFCIRDTKTKTVLFLGTFKSPV